ncbi:MAG: protein kinase [Myxococcales bacterium]|nr:protein kinase [Myxococcales bacterium]
MNAPPMLCAACGAESATDGDCAACGEPVLLNRRYRLEAIVGRGAVGTTYRAHDQQTGQAVAVKEIPVRHADRDLLDRLEREARILGELHHDRVPAYVAHFLIGAGKHRAFYLVQQFVDGATLAEEMKRRRYTEAEVLDVLDGVLELLGWLHALAPPVLHRDLQLKNVMRRKADGALVLIDFGAVRDATRDPDMGDSVVVGTYGYMAPEQFRGRAEARSDLYSAGVIAVVLLSRTDPLELANTEHTLDWEPVVPHVSEPTRALLRALLATDPAHRPPTAREARAALSRVRVGKLPFGDPPPAAQPAALVAVMEMPVGRPATPITAELRNRFNAREKLPAILMAITVGWIGVQNWYLRRYLRATMSLLFFWTGIPTLVSLIDALRLAFMSQERFDARFNPELVEFVRGDVRSVSDELRGLHSLRQEGVLTELEFRRQKARLLGDKVPGMIERFGTEVIDALAEAADDLSKVPEQLLTELEKAHRKAKKTKYRDLPPPKR